MKVLFSPIGDPSNYDKVEYKVNEKGPYNTYASFYAISQALSIDKIVVYAGLSLCDPNCNDYNCCKNSVTQNMKGNENSSVQSIRLINSPTQGDIVSTLQKCLKNHRFNLCWYLFANPISHVY
jgi:CRISPR/Cas system-associated protein Csx1